MRRTRNNLWRISTNNRSTTWTMIGAVAVLGAALSACANDGHAGAPKAEPAAASSSSAHVAAGAPLNPRLLRRFRPIKSEGFNAPLDADLVGLGQQLFHDPRLSSDATISCNSCHELAHSGVDHLATSPGVNKKRGNRNSPTVLNAAGSFAQFWDGRMGTIEEQAKGPILNPGEMAMPSGDDAVARLRRIPGYVERFGRVFHDAAEPITFDRVATAIGAFERRLATPGRWDKYLEGDENALTLKEREGLRTFLNSGCMVCHTGPLLGGATFERVGVVEPWPNQSDVGRMAITGSAADRMSFKVPSLRNVGETAPYFHDGSAATLEEAVRLMGRHQLGLELGADEVDSIAVWLRSLTGELPADLVAKPVLPL